MSAKRGVKLNRHRTAELDLHAVPFWHCPGWNSNTLLYRLVTERERERERHTHTHTHTCTHLHTHTHSLTHSLTHSHTHTHTYSQTHKLTHSLRHTHTHSQTHKLTHSDTHTHTLTHSQTHKLTHSHTQTHSHTLSLTLSLSHNPQTPPPPRHTLHYTAADRYQMLTLHSPEHHSSLYIIHMLTFPGIMVQFHHFKYSAPLNENSKMHYEKLFTHVESHTSTMSLLDSCEWHYIKAITSTTRQRDAHLLA